MKLFPLLRWTRHRREAEALAEEIEHHRSLIQADLESQGAPREEAAAASRRAMGNITLAREDAREVWIVRWADELLRDATYGLRGMRHEPTFAFTAILTLALGVATTTAAFSIADAELWKPLPFPRPDRLVAVTSRGRTEHASTDGLSGADLLDWRAAGGAAFSELALAGSAQRRVLQLQTAESVIVMDVTANYLATLGRGPTVGRTFDQGDAHGSRTAVLTDRAWRRLFGADPAIVGRPITLDGRPVTIIGVTRADDSVGRDPDMFVAVDEGSSSFLDRSEILAYGAIGRLRPGVDRGTARAQLQAAAARLAETRRSGRGDHTIYVEDLGDYFSGYNWRPLFFFIGASLIVLVLSTVNVATLLVSRGIRRQREFALRGALGGGAGALARQLLVEGALLAAPAGALGVLLASWMLGAVIPALPADFLARGTHIPVDLRVCLYSLAASGFATLLFALIPLPLARRGSSAVALRDGGRTGASPADGRARSVLLGLQIGLTVVLLAGAALFVKSFVALSRTPLGFDPVNVAALRISLSGPHYQTEADVLSYAQRLIENARAVPSARIVTVATTSPLGSGPLTFFARPDRPRPAAGEETRAILRSVGSEYFRTLAIPLVRGREFSPSDVNGAPRVAIVNTTLASRMFEPGEDPLGRTIELLPGSRSPWTRRPGPLQIVGIAANAKEVGLNEVEFADVYVPFPQMPASRFELIVRAETEPSGIASALRASAARADPSVPVTSLATFEQRVDEALQGDRLNVLLVGGFAVLAIALSSIGVYGAAAYYVQARTREFGIRLALGARPTALVRAALLRTGRLAMAGAIVGVASTLLIGRLLGDALYTVRGSHNGLLYEVSTTDPTMLTLAFIGVMSIATAAAGVPARRVTRVDPITALRHD